MKLRVGFMVGYDNHIYRAENTKSSRPCAARRQAIRRGEKKNAPDDALPHRNRGAHAQSASGSSARRSGSTESGFRGRAGDGPLPHGDELDRSGTGKRSAPPGAAARM